VTHTDAPVAGPGHRGPGRVIGLLGPTAVGKTAVGVELGRLLGTGVISCDSMQIYRSFSVLTNQPTSLDTEGVPHALVECIEPGAPFSAADYAALARPLIAESLSTRGWALVVGGTGLYMRAALAPLAMSAGSDPERRRALEARLENEGAGALHAELARIDPLAAEAIDPRNARRLVRALEAVGATGREWSGRSDLWDPVYDHPTTLVGLVCERSSLYRRIDARAAAIVGGGAVDEVRCFRKRSGLEASRPGLPGICSAIGYPEICRYLEGFQSLEETIVQVAGATRRYARRQLTWLSKLRDAVIIDLEHRAPRDVAQEILGIAGCEEQAKEPSRP
jgi:tRNA dimethylallyltransferase